MAEPQLQIEKRQDNLEKAIREIGNCVLSVDEQENIEKILRGEDLGETKENSESGS